MVQACLVRFFCDCSFSLNVLREIGDRFRVVRDLAKCVDRLVRNRPTRTMLAVACVDRFELARCNQQQNRVHRSFKNNGSFENGFRVRWFHSGTSTNSPFISSVYQVSALNNPSDPSPQPMRAHRISTWLSNSNANAIQPYLPAFAFPSQPVTEAIEHSPVDEAEPLSPVDEAEPLSPVDEAEPL